MSAPEIDVSIPDLSQLTDQYQAIGREVDAAGSAAALRKALQPWEQLRREIETWDAWTDLRFNQDTSNLEYQRARDWRDELRPKLTDLEIQLKRKLLAEPQRTYAAEAFGQHVCALWTADVATFEPSIKDDLVQESQLEAKYVELLASASFEFQGGTHNLSTIARFHEDSDRAVRHESNRLVWDWFAAHGDQLDSLYGQLVELRTAMAYKLGYPSYVELGYQRMARIGFDREDVERYRNSVLETIVPLAAELRAQQTDRLSLQRLYYWDEPIHDPSGNPCPQGDAKWMVEQGQAMFNEMGQGLGEFFQLLDRSGLLDLESREHKAGGGFCTAFPTVGWPFIFANFNGTKGDVEVLVHEMGHAFQCYSSREQPLLDYLWPTYEACEIHSMGLEFLVWPHMEKFFGHQAERFRQIHLAGAVLFLPYGVAVDHFQHLVYDHPQASAAERHAMWREVEQMYLPWRDYGDLDYLAQGTRWQLQRHIYLHPFYYIDYTLAQACALQFWVESESDYDGVLAAYAALCRRGGEASFGALAESAGLISPFAPGCLEQVAQAARSRLLGGNSLEAYD